MASFSLLATSTIDSHAMRAGNSSPFDSAPVSNQELSEIRGGFLNAGGLLIEFGINIKTFLDGNLQKDISFSTVKNDALEKNSDQLRQAIQVGNNNQAIPQELLDKLPAIVTIIQNSDDNKIIQNINTLDINVSNTRSLIDRQIGANTSKATVDSLR